MDTVRTSQVHAGGLCRCIFPAGIGYVLALQLCFAEEMDQEATIHDEEWVGRGC